MTAISTNRAWKIRADCQNPEDLEKLGSGLGAVDYMVSGLKLGMSRVDIEKIVRISYINSTEKRIKAHVGQIYRLLNEVHVGDLAVIPVKKGKSFFLVKVSQSSKISAKGNISFTMDLLRADVSLKEFDQDLRYSFMAIMKFCEIHRNNAFFRLEEVAQGFSDPGYD